MGNCMETYSQRQEEAAETQHLEEIERSCIGKKGASVKVVLTKEELQWLILQLKEKEGVGLEEVLEEIKRSRGKVEGWKPSLESILEIPEVPEMDRS